MNGMEIKYVVRKLHLYEEINCAADDETENGRLYKLQDSKFTGKKY